MEGLAIVALICSFLPFLVSMGGSGGVWKFLSFVFCCLSLVGAASVIGFGGGILAWVIAWSFTAIAVQARRSDERFSRMERNILAAKAAEDVSSPVSRLLQTGSAKRSFISAGQLIALVLVFGIAAALIVTGVNDLKTSSDGVATPRSAGVQTIAAMAPEKAVAQPPTARKCQISDFAVEGFAPKVFDDCKQTSCPALKLTGKLKNNCALAAGAQIKITAEDGKGKVVDTTDGWPASTRNIDPGATYSWGPSSVVQRGLRTPTGPFFARFFIGIILGLVAEFAFMGPSTRLMMSFSAARWMDRKQIGGWRFQHGCSTGRHALRLSFWQLGHLSA